MGWYGLFSSLKCTLLSVHAYVWYSGVTRYCLRPSLIGREEHIFPTSHSNTQLRTHTHSNSLMKHLSFCSSIGGPSVYQSVGRVSLHPRSDLGHTPPRDPEWTHPRIQGDTQENKTHKRIYTQRIPRGAHVQDKERPKHTRRRVLIVWVSNIIEKHTALFCLYLNWLSSCLGGVLLCYTFKCPIEKRERERIKLEEESEYPLMVSISLLCPSLPLNSPVPPPRS